MLTEDLRLVRTVPSDRQLAFQDMEFYAFVHFTVNTFTGREWGDGREEPACFAPTRLDAAQWTSALCGAGMKGLILTCKHHDGFCLWPSRLTQHTVAHSPFRDGRGDVVREVSDACRAAGLRFGVYLSPWDRNQPTYGQGKAYDDFFVGQLTELMSDYGDIFCVWFDGACGEGANGKKQYYDWERYYATIRRLQPNACINVCGPDIRWCGNEAGDTRPSEWSVVPRRTSDTEKIASMSQSADEALFRQRKISAGDIDLGSREALRDEAELIWYPAEVNTSIRPGWFYHAEEDDAVKPLNELKHIYIHSVGGNATFLLNIPPTREGLFHANDTARLRELGDWLRGAFSRNLLTEMPLRLTASPCRAGCAPENVLSDTPDSFYAPPDGITDAALEADWQRLSPVRYVVLKENLRMSQRVERFVLELHTAEGWKTVCEDTVIGHKRIVALDGTPASALRVRILDARVAPTIAFLGVYA